MEGTSLQDIVLDACPDASLETLEIGRATVVGFHAPDNTVWVALDERPPCPTIEQALGCVANMLVFCESCRETAFPTCHQEYRVTAERLRRFLGDDHYWRFVAHAPVQPQGGGTPLARLPTSLP